MGTPTGFLLLQTPRVAHMWDTDLQDLLQGCTLTVAQHGLLWSRTTARQEMISSLHSGPTFAQSSSAVSKLDLAYQLLRASCLCAKEKGTDSIYLSSQALNLAKRCSSFSGGFKTSQQFSSSVKGWRGKVESHRLIHPGQHFPVPGSGHTRAFRPAPFLSLVHNTLIFVVPNDGSFAYPMVLNRRL